MLPFSESMYTWKGAYWCVCVCVCVCARAHAFASVCVSVSEREIFINTTLHAHEYIP